MTKIDNGHLNTKLDLRRHFLRKYHQDVLPKVMDCCQGNGVLWNTLRREFPVASYWGIDEKPKKGRLAIKSQRVLSQAGWQENVIDIDTYGSPWKHWMAMLPNISRPTTVFLTIGQWQMGIDKLIIDALGLRELSVPKGILRKLVNQGAANLLAKMSDFAVEAVEAVEAGNCRYIGINIQKIIV